ncbi:serine/threonine protein kinase [Stanieria cyanosphaera PCC 7437]|uniref:Serine/threonine protein kinase n=1 Tax=Stanieria cyanosphaera (strain ATCC 29371 / PCC 7437) TaxID=111780 RepID=K9XS00_STAC7|nr:serine/threonine protein kinase [Stanieria cyanosphaera]AFZ35303.1 serine/threonine protein kinase [Stanieria cyanosphaera PCC 7437]
MLPKSQNSANLSEQFYHNGLEISPFIESIHQELLPHLEIESVEPYNPVVVHHLPQPWQLIGTGNYAGVFYHPNYIDLVVKIYAPGRLGWTEELEVYRRLGSHPAFSQCFYAEEGFLVLKRLYGVTLYDCLHRGLKIPPQVIKDIDQALKYIQEQGMYPHDVHGRNVMMYEGRGLVVDVSDFLREQPCRAWDDLKKAYYLIYLPFLYWLPLPIPYFILDLVRKSYRLFRRLTLRGV